jgi:hypothetical protein
VSMSDEITLTLPQDREFHRVAHLVLGGLALRLDLTIETLEDMQIALAALLDRADPEAEITISMSVREEMLETRVSPLDVSEDLDAPADDELNLRRVLSAVVDDVAIEGNSVRLTKRVPSNG